MLLVLIVESIPNQNTLCVATYQGDIAPNLMVLDATVHLIGPNGAREMPLTILSTGWHDPKCPTTWRVHAKVALPRGCIWWVGAYRKLRLRESWVSLSRSSSSMEGDRSALRVATTALRAYQEDMMKK